MKVYILATGLLLLFVSQSSASSFNICHDADAGINAFFSCVRRVGTLKLKEALDRIESAIHCDNDVCLVHSLCANGDLVTELRKQMLEPEVDELVGLQQRCGINNF
ncbi:antimicrobial peptide microplusin [Rhipicephalus sanguineus]|uniref:antimicrobial peptide microplusin n=1 Tax=Rhipicephalus sanguineus TaxID=34632 RepID=UPI001893DB75|nr:antimicrobial peptide microplusin [Rhipicephalus sanguineus]